MRRLLLVLLPLLLAAPAAHAETWTAPDRTGNVKSFTYSPEPQPCGTVEVVKEPDDVLTDIVDLTVQHDVDAVTVEVGMGAVKARHRFSTTINIRTPGPDFIVYVDRQEPRQDVATFLAKEAKPPKPDTCGAYGVAYLGIGCEGIAGEGIAGEADTTADVYRLTVPRACLRDPEWVRVGAAVRSIGGSAYDVWGRRKDKPKNLTVNPLSPRVAVDPAP